MWRVFGTVRVACLSLHRGMFVDSALLRWCFPLICIDLKPLPAIVFSHPHCLLSSCPSSPLFPRQGNRGLEEDTQRRGWGGVGGSAVGECLSITDVLGPLICLQAREGDKKNNKKKFQGLWFKKLRWSCVNYMKVKPWDMLVVACMCLCVRDRVCSDPDNVATGEQKHLPAFDNTNRNISRILTSTKTCRSVKNIEVSELGLPSE